MGKTTGLVWNMYVIPYATDIMMYAKTATIASILAKSFDLNLIVSLENKI